MLPKVSMRWSIQWRMHIQKRVKNSQAKRNTQKDRNEKEYRRLVKKQNIDQNIKLAAAKLRPVSRKVIVFEDVEYEGSTKLGEKKDTSLPLTAKYSPKYVESHWYDWWEKQGYFSPDKIKKAPTKFDQTDTFSMVIPPPNVTGKLHIGHALTAALEDALVRWKVMLGDDVLWLPGSDHAGIATQVMVEKHIEKESGETRDDLGPEKFKDAVWKWKKSKGNDIHLQLRRLGTSLDWDRTIFTLDEKYSHAVEEAFIRLHDEGLIYRENKCVNWCCYLQSTLSDLEVDSQEVLQPTLVDVPGCKNPVQFGMLHNFAYKLVRPVGDIDEIVVATTRLETIPGDEAVAVHPDDPRFSALIGQKLVHPIRFNKQIPIIADEAVDMNYGTGALKVTPAHDFTDFEIGVRHNLPVEPVINEEGRMNFKKPLLPPHIKTTKFDYLIGQKRFDARNTIMSQLRSMGLHRGSQPQKSVLRICSRSGDVVEPMVKEQWFVRTTDMAKEALKAVESGELNLVQKSHFEKQWKNWLTGTGDWCISRQIWWGHRIPAFRVVDKKNGDSVWVATRQQDEALEKARLKLPHSNVDDLVAKQDNDVLDTWFSSALYPFASLGWPGETEEMRKYYPLSVMETGSDLIFFWVARMTMLGIHLTGKIPFRNVLFHPLVRDKHNRKMSKSVGNVIDPLQVIDGSTMQDRLEMLKEYDLDSKDTEQAAKDFFSEGNGFIPVCGADALRISLLSHSTDAQSIRYETEQAILARKFCNKVWNSFAFVHHHALQDTDSLKQAFEKVDLDEMEIVDLWMRSRLASVVEDCNNALKNFRIPEALKVVKDLWVHDISAVYLRHCYSHVGDQRNIQENSQSDLTMKADLHDNSYTIAMVWNMIDVVETALRLLSPFAPFLCEELWQRLPEEILKTKKTESITISQFPTPEQHAKDRDLNLEGKLNFFFRLIDRVREDKTFFMLPNEYNLVFVCKLPQDLEILSNFDKFSRALVFCYSLEVYSYEKLEELKLCCLGTFEELEDVVILYRIKSSAFNSFLDNKSIMNQFKNAKALWIKKVESLEKSLRLPHKRSVTCDKILAESEKYLKRVKMNESILRVKENLDSQNQSSENFEAN